MNSSKIIEPMCGGEINNKESYVLDPGTKHDEKRQRIHSWSGKNHVYYQTIGNNYCSCNSFKHGNGAMCKHLIAKSCRPQLKICKVIPLGHKRYCGSVKLIEHFTGVYLYLGTFKFPVWVLDLQDGGSVYLYKSKTTQRWIFAEYYDSILNDEGVIRSKNIYLDSLLPPLDHWTEWQVWSPEQEKWINTDALVCVV